MKISNFFRKDPIHYSPHRVNKTNNSFPLPSSSLHNDSFRDWRQSWREVLQGKHTVQDTIAACTVAAVALPLNIALAVACGLPPQAGLLAGAIGGGIAAIFGGSSLQVTGPAAALNIMVLALTREFGGLGVAAACLLIGGVQLLLSAFAAGRFIRFVPESVLAGFTSGVGLKLLDQQLPELLGFNYSVFELAEMIHRPQWLHEVSWHSVVCGLFVALLVISCKPFKRFPAALVGIALITYVANHLYWSIERVGSLSGTISFPAFSLLTSEQWFNLLLATLPLALLASIESLLSAQATDRLIEAKTPHNSNLELFGQALGNIGSGLVGGMPVSGVIVRSTVNVQSGGKTRLASFLHSLALLFAIFYLSETLSFVPLSALAGLLCVVGVRLIEIKTLLHFMKENKPEAAAFLLAAIGTTTGHLLVGLLSGIVMQAFSRWIRETGKSLSVSPPNHTPPLAEGIRAIIASRAVSSRKPAHYSPQVESTNWLTQIRERAHLAASSFVHHRASVIGRVVLGEHVHIAAESSIRADEGAPFYIGSNSNIQDGVVIHALKEKWVHVAGEDWAVYIGENVSVAHQALVHGPCYIGSNCFIGFQAIVHDSIIGSHCYLGIGAIVVGVEIPEGRYVPHGVMVDSLSVVEGLPKVNDSHLHFNEDVVSVNKGLAAAYKKQAGQTEVLKKWRSIQYKNWKAAIDRF
jgi:SulP family sulfate permease